jgi:hypothetical protein
MRENEEFHDCDYYYDLEKILTNHDNYKDLRSLFPIQIKDPTGSATCRVFMLRIYL